MTNNALFTYDHSAASAEEGGPNRPTPHPGTAWGEIPWFPDPAAIQLGQERLKTFRRVRDEIAARVRGFMAQEAPR